MPASRNASRFGLLLIALVLSATAPAATNGFAIESAQARFEDDSVIVSGKIGLELSEEVETALVKGIPLDILIEFALYEDRRFIWDKRLGRWVLRAELKYHALSGLYLVTLQGSEDTKSFTTQREALRYVGTLSRVSLPFTDGVSRSNGDYALGLRVRLDIRSLPLQLRPVAYASSAWRLKSKRTKWAIQN